MLTTRDIIQVALMGTIDGVETRTWTGMVPAHLVHDVSRRSGGVSDCLDQVWVDRVSGGHSTLGFRSYDQGRRSFQGTAKHGVWLDEEPPDEPVNSPTTGESNVSFPRLASWYSAPSRHPPGTRRQAGAQLLR